MAKPGTSRAWPLCFRAFADGKPLVLTPPSRTPLVVILHTARAEKPLRAGHSAPARCRKAALRGSVVAGHRQPTACERSNPTSCGRQQEEKNKPLAAETQAQLTEGKPPAFGPADAKVSIVEFSDFQCPFCSRAADTVHSIREKYGDKVHFVFRQYPLSFHDKAHLSAEASLAAHAQGKFWELHDKMFANQGKLDRASLEQYAQEVGLDSAGFKSALDTEQYKGAVDAELDHGDAIAVDGTPTMFINGQRLSSPTSIEHVSKAIESALASANGS
jgi:protein-disulfide isomerase